MNDGFCIELASPADLDGICAAIGDSVRTVYPLYYTGEIVDFFLSLHEKSAVLSDIMSRIVYCVRLDGLVVGTVTVCGNTVKRLFVSPRYMRRGIGSALMDRAEEMIFSEHDCARLRDLRRFRARGFRICRAWICARPYRMYNMRRQRTVV